MAEIFAAVASGAGLVSLAIQLLESSRKLKGLYDTAKDAPSNVKDLCFDLETLSLQLRQLEQHRQHDRLNTELLDRCITQCQRRTDKVSDVVDDMARYIRRSAAFGRLYAAFKEPEVEKLLDELERAKSSLSFTYISYCQGWNMRNAAAHASILQSYGNALALQHMQLGSIQNDISDGNARLYDQLEDLRDHRKASQGSQIFHEPQGHVARSVRRRYIGTKKRNLLQFQLPLMAWLTGRTWEFAMYEAESLWTWNLHPVNYRPSDTLAFRYVREGNIPAVEKLLLARELSIWDVMTDRLSRQVTLLEIAVGHRQLALCEYFLTRYHSLRSDEHLHAAAFELSFVTDAGRGQYRDNLFELLVNKFEMDVDVIDASPQLSRFFRSHFHWFDELILSHQSVDFTSWPLQQRFRTAMRLIYRTPLDFQRTVGLPVSNQLAQLHDAHWGNALHWAAREWYKKANAYYPELVELPSSADHKKFIHALLENGALLHALDKRKRTPLTCMLDFNFYREDWQGWVPTQGANEGCAVQTVLWGRLLSEADVSLPEYVARENAILTARVGEDDIGLSDHREVNLSRFVLSGQGFLEVEVTTVTEMDIWEFRPPPGLFLESHEDCSTIIWPPSTCDNDRTCWQKTSSRELRSKPFIWSRNRELEERYPDAQLVFDAVFDGPQDDHSALALLMGRDRRRRAGESPRTRHRSSSMPPLGNAYLHHKHPHQFSLSGSQFRLPGMRMVYLDIHKCLFDSRWGLHVPDDDDEHSWRACMKGCQGRTDYSSQFEEFLEDTASRPKRVASELERLGRIIETD